MVVKKGKTLDNTTAANLSVGVSEVNLAELENEDVVAVLFDGDVVSEGTVMVPLRLIEDVVVLMDASDQQLLTKVRRCADLAGERITLEFDPVHIDVPLAAGVYGVDDVLKCRYLLGQDHQQQNNELTLQTTLPSCQHSCHFTGAQLIAER